MLGVWPAALTAGLAFAVPQFLVSNLHGPWLVDIVSGACSMAAVVVLLRFWQPRDSGSKAVERSEASVAPGQGRPRCRHGPRAQVFHAWLPWADPDGLHLVWGSPRSRTPSTALASAHD